VAASLIPLFSVTDDIISTSGSGLMMIEPPVEKEEKNLLFL
jgi:hypothetical protein